MKRSFPAAGIAASSRALRRTVAAGLALGAMMFPAACAKSGYVALSSREAPAEARANMPISSSREMGRPYRVLGYVFRPSEGHKSGMTAESELFYVVSPNSEQLAALRSKAAEMGADAIVGVELFPMLSGWGQPTGYTIGGWAVKFEQSPAPAVTATPAAALVPTTSAPVPPLPAPDAAPNGGAVPALSVAPPASSAP